MANDNNLFDDIVERELFIELVADGIPPPLAGYQVGWTPKRTKMNLADKDFAEIVAAARDRMVDSIEKSLIDLAKSKNLGAIQMVLYNLRGDVWKDVRRIEVKTEHTVNIGEIGAAKQVIMEMLREHGTKALQPGGGLDIIDAEIVDEHPND